MNMPDMTRLWVPLLPLAAAAAVLTPAPEAKACGCVAPQFPAVPVVQAGERIVFSQDGDQVEAHIQIQYEGPAEEFGWLVPVPDVPELLLSSDELFTQVTQATQPTYRLNRVFPDQCLPNGGRGVALPTSAESDSFQGDDGSSPLVARQVIGSFDTATLRADDRQEMFDWLEREGFFVPTGTEDVVGPYIKTGAYFVAVKLVSGAETGEIQPLALRYRSQYPMVPLILTSVAANPNMGVQVWVLGESRAIPRNYLHTVINEEQIDWFNAGQNYNEVIIAATNEAEAGQSFVTEYAGSTDLMDQRLFFQGRFPLRSELSSLSDPVEFLEQVIWRFPITGSLQATLAEALPIPVEFLEQGWDQLGFYQNARWLTQQWAEADPEAFEAWADAFDAAATTDGLFEREVNPLRHAQELFDGHDYMTRLYTTLSPDEMTRDPVFAFNPDLEDVSNIHDAFFEVSCDGAGGTLQLPDGREFRVNDGARWVETRVAADVPFSLRIERLFEEGAPTIAIDNADRISTGLTQTDGGCQATRPEDAAMLSALAAGLLFLAIRRRRRQA
ncbi:MAG: DUF2330 domain-containing protein [Myxococcota bacterium]